VAEGKIPIINPEWSSDKSKAFSVPQINKAAVILPPNLTYGDTPRRIDYLRGPWMIQEDLALLKDFRLTEKVNFEMRASAQNALNRALLAAPNTTQNSSTFGFITTAQGNSPRTIQLGSRISF